MKSKIKVGDVFLTNEGYEVEVIAYRVNTDITARFLDAYKYEFKTNQSNLRKGSIKNPYHPSVQGKGFMGVGKFKSRVNGRPSKYYAVWQAMFTRCYSKKSLEIHPTYKGCEVDEGWWNYQNFAEWYEKNQFSGMGYDLDKDVITQGNKTYSETTCAFIPREINSLLTKCSRAHGEVNLEGVAIRGSGYSVQTSINGVVLFIGLFRCPQEAHQAYVVAKETYVKEVANKWRGRIDERVYEALMSWTVNP